MEDKIIKLSGYEAPDFVEVDGVLYSLQKVGNAPPTPQESELEKAVQDSGTNGFSFFHEDGKLRGAELLAAESDEKIQEEDIAGIGYLPNTTYDKFLEKYSTKIFDLINSKALALDLPLVHGYYKEIDSNLVRYQAVLNYLVARTFKLDHERALLHAFAAKYSLLPKRICDKNGKLYFPELADEQSNLKIFEKLHTLFFKDITDEKTQKVLHPAQFMKKKEGGKLIYTALQSDGRRVKLEEDKNIKFLDDLSTLLQYINDDPDDNDLVLDQYANMVEATIMFGNYVLPSHFQLKGDPTSKTAHTVSDGLIFLKKYGGSYTQVADAIKKVCYDHQS